MTVKIGMNYGHQPASSYSGAQADSDFAYLKRLGFTNIRIAMPPYDSTTSLPNVQDMIVRAVAHGFYVVAGVTAGFGTNTITSARWSAHNSYVQNTFAPWCQSNKVSELCLDNEVELMLSSQVTAAQARSDIRSLASTIKTNNIFTGVVSYSTANQTSIVPPWYTANEGIGALDLIGFNTYSSAGPAGSGSSFETKCFNVSSGIGTKCYISEFGCITNGYSDYNEETAWYNDIVNRIADMQQELQNKLAYFFCFRGGGFGLPVDSFEIVRSDGFLHLAMNALLGLPLTSNTIELPTAYRRG